MSALAQSELDLVRRRRAELRLALGNLEQSLAAPALGDHATWRLRVHGAAETLLADFREHVEGSNGLHRDILATAPRLAGAVNRLGRDHDVLAARIDALLAQTSTDGDTAHIRDLGTDLIGALIKHRQHGADLIFEAYEADLGGSG